MLLEIQCMLAAGKLEDLKMFSLSLYRQRTYRFSSSSFVCVLFSVEHAVRMTLQSNS